MEAKMAKEKNLKDRIETIAALCRNLQESREIEVRSRICYKPLTTRP
jgi:hypothetical protein